MLRMPCITLVFGLIAHAQTLEITPTTVDRGSANILRVVLKPSAEKPIVAVQWDLVYPESLRIEPSGVVSGAAAEAFGKSVTCANKLPDGANRRLTCILAGGVHALSAGVIAIIRFEAGVSTPAATLDVDLEKVTGVSPSAQSVPMKAAKTSVTVR
jgi:hypothetical protein